MDNPTTPEFSIGFLEGILENLAAKNYPTAADALEHLHNIEQTLKESKALAAVQTEKINRLDLILRGNNY